MIATAALRQRVTLHPIAGTSGEGVDVFGAPIEDVPARVTVRSRVIRNGDGHDVVSTPVCVTRPRTDIAEGSLVVLGVTTWEVDEVDQSRELNRPWATVFTLTGERPTPVPEPEEEP